MGTTLNWSNATLRSTLECERAVMYAIVSATARDRVRIPFAATHGAAPALIRTPRHRRYLTRRGRTPSCGLQSRGLFQQPETLQELVLPEELLPKNAVIGSKSRRPLCSHDLKFRSSRSLILTRHLRMPT